jgi:hypothetical protein
LKIKGYLRNRVPKRRLKQKSLKRMKKLKNTKALVIRQSLKKNWKITQKLKK